MRLRKLASRMPDEPLACVRINIAVAGAMLVGEALRQTDSFALSATDPLELDPINRN